jgi:AbrB family looped-hinge helix DNA binding protein
MTMARWPQAYQIYHLKLDGRGRIVLPARVRARYHIASGDTITLIDDEYGLHIKTRERIVAETQT